MLDAIALATLLKTCAPQVHPATMRAVIRQESTGEPWAVGNNTNPRLSGTFKTKEAAVATALRAVKQGHSVDMGIAQINSAWLPKLGLTVGQVMEPCQNVQASAYILSSNYAVAVKKHGEGQKALQAAIAAYNTGKFSGSRGACYVSNVLSSIDGRRKRDCAAEAKGSTGRHAGGSTLKNPPAVRRGHAPAGAVVIFAAAP